MSSIYKLFRAGVAGKLKDLWGLKHASLVKGAAFWGEVEVAAFQERQLKLVLNHALKSVPYYRSRKAIYSVLLEKTGAAFWQAFEAIPTLTKSVLREKNFEFVSEKKSFLTTFHTTSGTSGTPIRIFASLSERSLTKAVLTPWFQKITGRPRYRTLVLSGFAVPPKNKNQICWDEPLNRTTYLSIYCLSDNYAKDIERELGRRGKIDLIYGYASAVREFGQLLKRNSLKLDGIRAVVTTSEVLYSNWRAEIAESVGAPVYNLYGCQEGTHLFLDSGNGELHVQPLVGMLHEVHADDDDGKKIVVTGLVRRSFPLIKYEIGDSVEIKEKNAISQAAAVLSAVEGRSEDLVRKRDGSKVGYLCFHLTKDLGGIVEAQLVQRGFGMFVLKLVVDRGYSKDCEKIIGSNLNRRLGEENDLEIQYVAEIERGSKGKFKAVIVEPFEA